MPKIDPRPLGGGEAKLEDQPDQVIWLKWNLLLQIIDEAARDGKEPGDATRQLRVVTQEVVRRGLMTAEIKQIQDGHLMTRYYVMEQLIGKYPKSENAQETWRMVIAEMKRRGIKPPDRIVEADALSLTNKMPKAKTARKPENEQTPTAGGLIIEYTDEPDENVEFYIDFGRDENA